MHLNNLSIRAFCSSLCGTGLFILLLLISVALLAVSDRGRSVSWHMYVWHCYEAKQPDTHGTYYSVENVGGGGGGVGGGAAL